MTRDPKITHKIMSSIKSKNTEPELLLRKALWKRGLRYRVNYEKLIGKPDIVFTKARIVIFCDGDFWHGHNWALRGIPSLEDELASYSTLWKDKILKNIERDKKNNEVLKELGWTVIRFWESEIRKNLKECVCYVEEQYELRHNQSTSSIRAQQLQN